MTKYGRVCVRKFIRGDGQVSGPNGLTYEGRPMCEDGKKCSSGV